MMTSTSETHRTIYVRNRGRVYVNGVLLVTLVGGSGVPWGPNRWQSEAPHTPVGQVVRKRPAAPARDGK